MNIDALRSDVLGPPIGLGLATGEYDIPYDKQLREMPLHGTPIYIEKDGKIVALRS
jgi:hypothetical protein